MGVPLERSAVEEFSWKCDRERERSHEKIDRGCKEKPTEWTDRNEPSKGADVGTIVLVNKCCVIRE